MAVMKVSNDMFKEKVLSNPKPVLVDFYADWCGPCKMIAPTVEELDKELENVVVCKVNVDVSPELAVLYGVEYIPTIVAHGFNGWRFTSYPLIDMLVVGKDGYYINLKYADHYGQEFFVPWGKEPISMGKWIA